MMARSLMQALALAVMDAVERAEFHDGVRMLVLDLTASATAASILEESFR